MVREQMEGSQYLPPQGLHTACEDHISPTARLLALPHRHIPPPLGEPQRDVYSIGWSRTEEGCALVQVPKGRLYSAARFAGHRAPRPHSRGGPGSLDCLRSSPR